MFEKIPTQQEDIKKISPMPIPEKLATAQQELTVNEKEFIVGLRQAGLGEKEVGEQLRKLREKEGQKIDYNNRIKEGKSYLHNLWSKGAKSETVELFIEGLKKQWSGLGMTSEEIEKELDKARADRAKIEKMMH